MERSRREKAPSADALKKRAALDDIRAAREGKKSRLDSLAVRSL
jgi:hypothetical protein